MMKGFFFVVQVYKFLVGIEQGRRVIFYICYVIDCVVFFYFNLGIFIGEFCMSVFCLLYGVVDVFMGVGVQYVYFFFVIDKGNVRQC